MDTLINSLISSERGEARISLEVTTFCNSMCCHCFVRAAQRDHVQLSFNDACSIIAEAYAAGFRILHITGGEPFLWKPLFEFIKTAFAMGYTTIMCNTNGTLLTIDNCHRLQAFADKLIFSVSLQGIGIHHDSIRGIGSWDMTTKGIKTALENDLRIVIFSVVNKKLLSFLPEFIEFVFKKFQGVEHISLIQLIRALKDNVSISDNMLSPIDFIKMIKIAALHNLAGRSVSVLENPLANILATMLNMPWLPQSLPMYRSGRITVLADKTITFSHSDDRSLGIYTQGCLNKILKTAPYTNGIAPDAIACPQCNYYTLCAKHLMLQPSSENRQYDSQSFFCKEVLDAAAQYAYNEVN